ncbi:MAG TPA: DUF4144 family protein [Methylotenera sp.]|jgi:hypothetical protein
MSQPDQLVQWPAIIKLHADDELIFVSDAAQFTDDDTLQLTHIQAQDRLIDSSGAVYRISKGQSLELVSSDLSLSLHEVEVLLRLHLSNNGNCCVSKFHAHSIHEALTSVFT